MKQFVLDSVTRINKQDMVEQQVSFFKMTVFYSDSLNILMFFLFQDQIRQEIFIPSTRYNPRGIEFRGGRGGGIRGRSRGGDISSNYYPVSIYLQSICIATVH